MSKQILHVLFSLSAAGTLRQVLARQGRFERVACPHDDFSFGPIGGDDAARAAWAETELGITDWESVTAMTTPFLQESCSDDVLPVAWISRSYTRSYAGFLWWLSHLEDAPCKIIDVTDLMIEDARQDSASRLAVSPAALLPEQMSTQLKTPTDLLAVERAEYQALWKKLLTENAPFRILERDGSLVSAPINQFDPVLLSCATQSWQKTARIVGEALTRFRNDGVHQTGDLVLYSRICALAERGALEWRGDLASMQDCELRRPTSGLD